MDRLHSMRVFSRVIDEGSFAAAARELNLSPAAVTRLVADLEEHLGARSLIARGFPEDLVRRVLKLVVQSEYKRRQAAPALRVTARAFGEGWRFPIAQRYRH